MERIGNLKILSRTTDFVLSLPKGEYNYFQTHSCFYLRNLGLKENHECKFIEHQRSSFPDKSYKVYINDKFYNEFYLQQAILSTYNLNIYKYQYQSDKNKKNDNNELIDIRFYPVYFENNNRN